MSRSRKSGRRDREEGQRRKKAEKKEIKEGIVEEGKDQNNKEKKTKTNKQLYFVKREETLKLYTILFVGSVECV